MWNPPIALTPEEQQMAARTRKARKFFVFLRERRHELLDATFQDTLAETSSAGPGGKEPVEAGMLALATLLQAYCHVGDRDAVELTVMDKRWQMVLGCPGAEQPPLSQSTLWNFRMCGSWRITWTKSCWSAPSPWQSRPGALAPGNCGQPWTPRPCLGLGTWRTP